MPWPRLYASSPDATKIAASGEQRISADSHMKEPSTVWEERLPAAFRGQDIGLPKRNRGKRPNDRDGGWDPDARLKDMAIGGVSAEVLYPTKGLGLFHLDDGPLQEACFRVYNNWLIEYCAVAGDRLVGVVLISVYDIGTAVRERQL